MTDFERTFLQVVVVLMLVVCAFSRTWFQLVVRFTFFGLLIGFLVTIFHS